MELPFRHLKQTSRFAQPPQDPDLSHPDIPPTTSYTPGPGPNEPCPENLTMFQAFEWNCPEDQKHWTRLASEMPSLKSIGIDNMWIPPGCKGGWHGSNGYDIYDLYDLGEFKQKDSIGTKWGTKGELVEMIAAARRYGIGIYWDAVLNHKAAADFSEPCYAIKVDPKGARLTSRCKLPINQAHPLASYIPLVHVALGLLIRPLYQTVPRKLESQLRSKLGPVSIFPAEMVDIAL